jgi:hypothetical protein
LPRRGLTRGQYAPAGVAAEGAGFDKGSDLPAEFGTEAGTEAEEAGEAELVGRGVALRPDEGEKAFAK